MGEEKKRFRTCGPTSKHLWGGVTGLMDGEDTHGPPLRHGPVAFAGRTGAVLDIWGPGRGVARSGLV